MKLSDTLLQQEGLSMAHDGATYCGTRGEYTFLILMGRNELVVSVLRGGEEPDKESFRDFVKARPELSGCKTAGTRVIFSLRPGAAAKSYAGKIHTLLPELLSFLHENGYENCCEISHAVGETVGCMTSGVPQLVAPALFTELSRKADQNERIQAETPENIGRGILGAVIGGVIGAAVIVLIGQLGYVAALSGAIMAVGVLKGYEMLGGKLTKKGIVISCVIMLVMTYIGDKLDWAIVLLTEGGGADAGFNLFECYRLIPLMISEGVIEMTSFVADLVLIYLFLLLGAVPAILSKVREKSQAGVMVKIGSAANYGVNIQ